MIHRYDYNQLDLVHLNGAISVPSSMHSYSLGVEFMRDWFLDRMPEDFFKTVYINGKNVMDDFRKFNREKILTVQKPALSIVPTINTEYNRDTVDLKLGGRDVLVRRSNYYKDAFLKDDDNNVFLGSNEYLTIFFIISFNCFIHWFHPERETTNNSNTHKNIQNCTQTEIIRKRLNNILLNTFS